ncbi:MAG: GNAT family N-acetyltransferase [Opitutaceae bacterium]|jgi:putative acetyltransferase|nr:GNAT family N-acetyltransferase [Opitutaceae bacterium]
MLTVRVDDLSGPEVSALLTEHLADVRSISPLESVHALDLTRLRHPDVTCWTVWAGSALAGCGALRELTSRHGEIKSMRTAQAFRRRGVGKHMLDHLLATAQQRRYERLSLETGSQPEFEPARRLYTAAGFTECPPFGDYREDPNSIFMTLRLGAE